METLDKQKIQNTLSDLLQNFNDANNEESFSRERMCEISQKMSSNMKNMVDFIVDYVNTEYERMEDVMERRPFDIEDINSFANYMNSYNDIIYDNIREVFNVNNPSINSLHFVDTITFLVLHHFDVRYNEQSPLKA